MPALGDKGIPAIVTGFGLPDSHIHSPNERLRAEYVPLGIATACELFREPRRALATEARGQPDRGVLARGRRALNRPGRGEADRRR